MRGFFIQKKEIDALSFFDDESGSPFIFLNDTKSAERVRFDCAHELGHTVMHTHNKYVRNEVDNRILETEADTTFQLFENGVANPTAITTTGVLDVDILVDSNCVLNSVNSLKSITIVNTETATTITNVVVNIDKVV